MQSVRSKKLLKLKGHDPGSNRRIIDHMPNIIPMSYCGKNSNHIIWHDFFKDIKWLKFFQKSSAPKFNIGLSNLVSAAVLLLSSSSFSHSTLLAWSKALSIYELYDRTSIQLWHLFSPRISFPTATHLFTSPLIFFSGAQSINPILRWVFVNGYDPINLLLSVAA